MKRLLTSAVAVLLLLSVVSCDTEIPPDTSDTAEVTGTETEKETDTVTDIVTEEPVVDEDPVFYEKTDRDPLNPQTVDVSGADWNSTIAYANERADGVSGKFLGAERKEFLIKNEKSLLKYDLTGEGNKRVAGLYNPDGKPYFENTMDAYIVNSAGTVFNSAYSLTNGRMNSNRIGYYYYDFRFRDQDFTSPDSGNDEDSVDLIAKNVKWSTNDISKYTKKNGVITYTVSSAIDPFLYCGVSYSTEKYDAVRITIKPEISTVAYIYLIAGSQTNFNPQQITNFKCTAGKWTTVIVPFSSIPDYTGNVKGFRIDCGSQAGEVVEIKEIKAINRGGSTAPFALERIFHTYSDKMHEVVRAVATGEYSDGGRFETQTVIPADTVRKLVIKNAAGEVSELDGFDFSTTEYVGFDIIGTGVFGVIMPVAENNGYINVELKDGNYVITRGLEIKETVKKGEDIYFGHRLYTSTSHQFNDLRKEAYIERNPLTDVFIAKEADNAKYTGYDALTGCYAFTVKGTEFATAFKNGDKQFQINALMCGDGVADRTVYIQTAENYATRRGRIECAAILDENNYMLPLPLEVGKNFDGENEEPLYWPERGTGTAAFGEVYVPMTIGKDENKRFTVVHLYQNWGNYPLKQISFIAFHIPYYHLSVGVTETNCITPYFVNGKDAWMLPDFRANSAPFWENGRGTQHTSVGKLYFLQYKDAEGNTNKTESQFANIVSSGPVYADINLYYLSDDGKIDVSYRHAEMAQTDENRTYYKIRLEVKDDVNISDFRRDFSFFSFDSHGIHFDKVGYLNENGESVIEDVKETDRLIKLGKEYPYFDYFGGSEKESVNFSLIVVRSDITVGGVKYDGNFIFRDRFEGTINIGALTLDLGAATLKKGDVLELDLVLMPWGYSTSKNDKNVLDVRQDSCYDPYKLTVVEGEPYEDCFIPSLRAVNNTATFKISGGRSTAAVRVYGFDSYKTPTVTFKADGVEKDIKLAGVNGYDGYQVNRDDDGTYSFSFNVDMNKAKEYEITVKQ